MPFSWAAARPCAICIAYSSGSANREGPLAQPLAQRPALEQLGDDVGRAAVFADVEDGEDVGVIERSRGARFLLESLETVAVLRKRRRQHLDGDVAAEPRVAGAVHLAHRPRPQQGNDLVGTESGAWSKSHAL